MENYNEDNGKYSFWKTLKHKICIWWFEINGGNRKPKT